MWVEFFKGVSEDCTFHNPASLNEIAKVEEQLSAVLPQQLKEILLETNGLKGCYDLGLIWSIDEIMNENMRYRDDYFKEHYMPFDNLIFFADSGIGDLFCFPVLGKGACKDDVFVWNHENDSRQWVAPTISKYVEWWLHGTIKI
ncbi:SMI1/KNR4 family protein [Paenibacillus chartarius]|uniref:SMI1/KNR4 family protein n=1 Tax=Paenibacillus chartarius TaxID=747481 RepID=A0ABV6DM78_9BACL